MKQCTKCKETKTLDEFSNDNDVYVCYHWSNMRPCEKKENMSKHDKILPELIAKQHQLAKQFNSLFV
jgi:hypothetical protein